MSLRNAFLLLVLPLLLYLPSVVNSDFVALDDELLIIDNPIAHGLTWGNLQTAFTSYDPELYIPLTLLTYQIEYSLFGPTPLPYHITNLLLHLGSTFLLFSIFRKFLNEKTALIAALLFAIHPLNTETVMWASARKDLLMGFFFLLSLNFYLRSYDSISDRSSDSKIAALRLSNRSYGMVTFVFACLSKVTAVTLPFLLLLIDWYFSLSLSRERARERVLEKIPYFVISLLFILIALFGKNVQSSFITPLLISFIAIPFSLSKFFAPINLSIFYPFTDDITWHHPQILFGFFVIAAITLVTWMLRKRSPLPLLTWVIFLILLGPSLTNVLKGAEYGSMDIYLTSDRYMYLPLISLLPLIAYIVTRKPFIYVTPIVILILSYATFTQAKTWENSETLFTQAIAAQKNTHVAYNNLAGIYAQNGDTKRALELYKNANDIKPTWRTFFNLGQIYGTLDRYIDAITAYEELLKIRPDYAEAIAQLGGLLLRTGNVEEALMHLERARMLDPNLTSVHYNLGLIYEHSGNKPQAQESFQRVLELNPEDIQAKRKLGKS